jgi:hypothetical protein
MKKLTKEQKEELKRLADEIMNLATSVVDDYEMNPSEMSGSITEVHIDSPILEDEEPIEDQATKDRKRWSG